MQSDAMSRLEGGRRMRGEARKKAPVLSIVTVIFQAKEECQKLLKNIFEFDHDVFEMIIIDGGSTDGTVEVLRQWDEKIDYWLSEPDSGIYDAMNKGIAVAWGEYILHLNEGDRLKFIPRDSLIKCLTQGVDVAAFPVSIDCGEIFQPRTGFPMRFTNTWHHQGTFYRRGRHLSYDARYRVFGDFDLNQRMLKSGRTVRLFDQVVSCHRDGGISASGAGLHEVYRSVRDNFGARYIALLFLRFKYKGIQQRVKRLHWWLSSKFGKR